MTQRSPAPSALHAGTTQILLLGTTSHIQWDILDVFPRFTPSTIPHHYSIGDPACAREGCKDMDFLKIWLGGFDQTNAQSSCWSSIQCPNNLNNAYKSYCKMILTAAKKSIPCGICKVNVMTRNVKIYFVPTQKQKTPKVGTKQQMSSSAG